MRNRWIIVAVLVLALIVVCVGILAATFLMLAPMRAFNAQPNFPVRIGPSIGTVSADATEEKSLAVSTPATLDVETPFGDITIQGGDTDEIQITAHKRAWGDSKAEAEQALEDLEVVIDQDGSQVTIRVQNNRASGLNLNNQGGAVSFEVTVPVDTTVRTVTQSGKVVLSGTQGKADLTSDFGTIQVNDFAGGLAVHSKSGRVSARRIKLLDDELGDVSLRSDFGDVTLEDAVTQKVELYSGSGTVTLTNGQVDGAVQLTSDFGNLSFKTGRASALNATTRSGTVTLVDLTIGNEVVAHSDFGNLTLTRVTATSYNLDSNSGTIEADGASGSLKAHSGFGNITVNGGKELTLDLETESGRLTYLGSLGAGPHRLVTKFGDVRLSLPDDTAFDFDLQTDFGHIDASFDTQIFGKPDEHHWRGKVNGGGASLTVSTSNGNIYLESMENY